MDLVPKEALANTRGGSYFLSDKQLVEVEAEKLTDFSFMMEEVAKEYSNLYFGSVRHPQNNGYIISWWVRDEHGTEEGGDPKVLPWG